VTEHVDIVKNEWLSGFQVRVAIVTLDGEDVKVATGDPSWSEFVHRPIWDAASAEYIYSSKEPAHFFNMLPRAINSSYLFALNQHSIEDCPFRDGNVLPLKRGGLEAAAS
jgi:hypothetical protein